MINHQAIEQKNQVLEDTDTLVVEDVLKVMEKYSNKNDVYQTFKKLLKSHISNQIAQLETKKMQYEKKWNCSYANFEKVSSTWKNSASYDLEQDYYCWGEIVSELQYYQTRFSNQKII